MDIERWFQGTVVDVNDPLKMGRIKVKELVGQNKENTDNLFWCHVIMPPTGANKYLSRMYWMKYSIGDAEWFEKEKEFGKDVWAAMQPDIMQKFRDANPNKDNANKERRIK